MPTATAFSSAPTPAGRSRGWPAGRDAGAFVTDENGVSKIDVPLFVVQGQDDPRAPVSEAGQIVTALREYGSPVRYMNALNEGHGFRRKENRDLFREAAILFP